MVLRDRPRCQSVRLVAALRRLSHTRLGPGSDVSTRGIVLVHGYGCNRGLWTDWLRQLGKHHVPAVAVNLEPPWASIDRYEQDIERAVSALESATGMAPVLVAHSMGGLAARHWYSRQRDPARIHHLITLARRTTAPACPIRDRRQRAADAAWEPVPEHAFSCRNSATPTSNHVLLQPLRQHRVPAPHATLADAANHHLVGCAHVKMIEHPDCWAAVMKLLPIESPDSQGQQRATQP